MARLSRSLGTSSAPWGQPGMGRGNAEFRFGGVSWTERGIALLSESDRATRVSRTWLIDAPGAAPRKLWERKQQDRYTDPGVPMMRANWDPSLVGCLWRV